MNAEKFMEMACKEALEGIIAQEGGPFGAVVVKDGKAIAAGHNRVLSARDSTAHAEINAIRKAEQLLGSHDLTGCELYTTSFPCPMCLGAIMWARIGKVYYGTSAEEVAEVGFDDKAFYEAIMMLKANDQVHLVHENSEACRNLFKQWMKMENRELY